MNKIFSIGAILFLHVDSQFSAGSLVERCIKNGCFIISSKVVLFIINTLNSWILVQGNSLGCFDSDSFARLPSWISIHSKRKGPTCTLLRKSQNAYALSIPWVPVNVAAIFDQTKYRKVLCPTNNTGSALIVIFNYWRIFPPPNDYTTTTQAIWNVWR